MVTLVIQSKWFKCVSNRAGPVSLQAANRLLQNVFINQLYLLFFSRLAGLPYRAQAPQLWPPRSPRVTAHGTILLQL